MARLNLHPPSENSEIEDTSEGPTVEDKSCRDREKEKRKNLSKGNWKLSESQLLQHFGEAVLNSRRQLTKLIAFAKVAPNFTEVLPYLKKAQARRQAGTVYRSGISREADWLVTDIIGAMDDYKKEAMAKQKSTKDTLRRKREAPVHKDTPVKKRQRNERQASQLPTASQKPLASRPLAAPIPHTNPITTRRAAQLKASMEYKPNDRHLDAVSSRADSTDRYDSIINNLLDSDDEPNSSCADETEPAAVEQHLDEVIQHSSLNSTVDQSSVSDAQMSGGPKDDATDATKAGTSNGEAIEENCGPAYYNNPGSRSSFADDQMSRQVGDSTGSGREAEEGLDKNRELPSCDGALDHSLYPHTHRPDQAGHIVGLRMGQEEVGIQTGEDDLALSEYLTSESARISSKLQKLRGILSDCDESLRIMTDSQVSEESNLTDYRNNARIAKERLDMAQQMEQYCATFESMADPRDDTSSQQVQSLLNTASDCRKTCQAAFERAQAEIEAMERKSNTRQEHVSRIEETRQNATTELQAWKGWQADGGKIFPALISLSYLNNLRL